MLVLTTLFLVLPYLFPLLLYTLHLHIPFTRTLSHAPQSTMTSRSLLAFSPHHSPPTLLPSLPLRSCCLSLSSNLPSLFSLLCPPHSYPSLSSFSLLTSLHFTNYPPLLSFPSSQCRQLLTNGICNDTVMFKFTSHWLKSAIASSVSV